MHDIILVIDNIVMLKYKKIKLYLSKVKLNLWRKYEKINVDE